MGNDTMHVEKPTKRSRRLRNWKRHREAFRSIPSRFHTSVAVGNKQPLQLDYISVSRMCIKQTSAGTIGENCTRVIADELWAGEVRGGGTVRVERVAENGLRKGNALRLNRAVDWQLGMSSDGEERDRRHVV